MKIIQKTTGEVVRNINRIDKSAEFKLIGETISDRDQASANLPDLVCLSHLRWDFVYQRPQHLLSRYAREGRRVFFVEEPVYDAGTMRIEVSERESGVRVVVPHLPEGLVSWVATDAVQQGLIDRLFAEHNIRDHVLWYYTPMAMGFTHHLQPQAVVYDCMDELAAFKNAPQALRFRETELFRRADLVFTGGQSLYEAKRQQHPQHRHIHAFPSGVFVGLIKRVDSLRANGISATSHPAR